MIYGKADYPYGILPVPIFITEPAIGNGFGLAGVYFHDPDPAWKGNLHDERGRQRPSSITAGAAGATENGSSFYGGVHFGHYKHDTIRYQGILGGADINLDFYGSGDNSGDTLKSWELWFLFVLQLQTYVGKHRPDHRGRVAGYHGLP